MTKRQAFWIVGSFVGLMALTPVIAGEMTGVGPEARELPARLAVAKGYGFDPGSKTRLAREAARPAEARAAFDRLQAFLVQKNAFDLPKTNPALIVRPPRGAPPAPASLPPARSLEELRPRLRELGRLSRAAQGGSHYDWEKGYDLLFPQYAPLKGAMNAADALARFDAHRGAWSEATQDLIDASDPWLAYGDQPTIIGELVRGASLAILFRAAGALLSRPAYPAAEARRLHTLFAGPQFDQTVPIGEIVVQEVSAQYAILDDPKFLRDVNASVSGEGMRDFTYAARLPGVRQAWQSDLLRHLNEAIPHLPADRYDFTGQARVIEAYERATSRPRGIVGRFSDVVGGVFRTATIDALRRREAQRRVLLLATGLRTGEPEAALRRRLGRLAIDPYDGKSLRVDRALEVPYWLDAYLPGIRERDLRVVYSVGPDGTDNGGQTAKKGTDPIDITLPISSAPIAR